MARKKDRTNISLGPIILMLIFIILAMVGSLVMSLLEIDGSRPAIVSGALETSMVVVRNIFSREGIIYLFSNIITNFQLLQPLVLLLVSLFAVSIGEASGFFKHIFSFFKKYRSVTITAMVVSISVVVTFFGSYSYIILIPFVAVMYKHIGRSPVLGIITVFLGLTLGFGAGIFYNYNHIILGSLTELAALTVDPNYSYSLFSNIYIMIASTILMIFLLTILIQKYITKKIGEKADYEDELVISNKALIFSLVAFVICLAGIILLILPGGILLDNTGEGYISKLLGNTAPFQLSFVFIFLLITSICSLVYGLITKNLKDNHDFCWGYTRGLNNIGYLFVLMFLATILIGIIDWTNIGVVVITRLLDLLVLLNFSGIMLIITTVIFIILMSVLVPNTAEKWLLISPLLIPLFMRANFTPDFAQFIFRVADGIGSSLTPVFIYFIIMIGFIQKYNLKENKVTLFGTYRLIMPVILWAVVIWLFILIAWYLVGLPIGVGTVITM